MKNGFTFLLLLLLLCLPFAGCAQPREPADPPLSQAFAGKGEEPSVHYAQGQALEEEGRTEEAMQRYRLAVERGHVPAQTAYLRLGLLTQAADLPGEAAQRAMLLEGAGQLDDWALAELSRFCAQGIGGDVDADLAQVFAHMSGAPNARLYLENLYAARVQDGRRNAVLSDLKTILPASLLDALLPVVYADGLYDWMAANALSPSAPERITFGESAFMFPEGDYQYYVADFDKDGREECLQISQQGPFRTDISLYIADEDGYFLETVFDASAAGGRSWLLLWEDGYYLALFRDETHGGTAGILEIYPLQGLALEEGASLALRLPAPNPEAWGELVTRAQPLPPAVEEAYANAAAQLLAQDPASADRGKFTLLDAPEAAVGMEGQRAPESAAKSFLSALGDSGGASALSSMQSLYALDDLEDGPAYFLMSRRPPHYPGMAYLALFQQQDGDPLLLRSSLFLPKSMAETDVLVERIRFAPLR